MIQPIHVQLHTIRLRQQRRQQDIADALGVHQQTISYWERGLSNPSVRSADAWAADLNHQLIATANGTAIGTLADLLPQLPKLRRARGITQEEVGHRMRASTNGVTKVEMRIRAGHRVMLVTAEWYLAGFGYEVGLVPARALERAA